MRRWLLRGFLLAVVLLLGWWVWSIFFPNPEKVIRRRLSELGQLASCGVNEGELAKAYNAQKLVSYCTPDVSVAVTVMGYQASATNREDLVNYALMARIQHAPITVQLYDIVVNLAPNKGSATADLTSRVRASPDIDSIQELRFRLKKIGSQWLISRVELNKTLR